LSEHVNFSHKKKKKKKVPLKVKMEIKNIIFFPVL
jgi:hypothetical protein